MTGTSVWSRLAGRAKGRLLTDISAAVRRVLKPDFEAEIRTLRGEIAVLTEGLTTERAAWERRLALLEPLVLEHPEVLSATRTDNSFASPVVSIIMPTWNRADVIGAAIRSVQAQRFTDWELIVVDDGSTDHTADVVSEFTSDNRIRYIARSHAGQCAARNHGLSLAKGQLIAYLDSDNLWYPDFVAAGVGAFAAKPAIDCLYGAMVTDAHVPGELILHEPFDRERLLDGNYIGITAFMHRKTMIERYGTFDEGLKSLEDWDLILRYTVDAPSYRLPVLAVRYRVMDQRRVSATAQIEVADGRIREKWSARDP